MSSAGFFRRFPREAVPGQPPAQDKKSRDVRPHPARSMPGGHDRRRQRGNLAIAAGDPTMSRVEPRPPRPVIKTLPFHLLVSAPLVALLFTRLWVVGLCLLPVALTLAWLEAGGELPRWLLAQETDAPEDGNID